MDTYISVADAVGVGLEDYESHWCVTHPQLNIPPELQYSSTCHDDVPRPGLPPMRK